MPRVTCDRRDLGRERREVEATENRPQDPSRVIRGKRVLGNLEDDHALEALGLTDVGIRDAHHYDAR